MSFAGIIRHWRTHRAQTHELEALGYEEVEAIARDIGVSEDVLMSLAAHGPNAGAELYRLMRELSLDSEAIAHKDPAMMRDMSIACSGCQEVGYCRRDLDRGVAASTYTQYCPNRDTLQDLQVQRNG